MSYVHTTTISEPTAAQVRYLNSLLNEAARMLAERDRITGAEWPEAVIAVARMRDTDGRTRREVSAMIDAAKTNNAKLRTELDDLKSADQYRWQHGQDDWDDYDADMAYERQLETNDQYRWEVDEDERRAMFFSGH